MTRPPRTTRIEPQWPRNGPQIFAGRKIGVLAGPGADAALVADLCTAAEQEQASVEFVSDAYAHYKFIGHCADAEPLFAAAGLSPLRDDGFIPLRNSGRRRSP